MYDDDDGNYGFKVNGYDDDTDEPLDLPEELGEDLGLDDDDDPDSRYT